MAFCVNRILPDKGKWEILPVVSNFSDYSSRTTLMMKGAAIFVEPGVDPKESA